MNRPPEDLLQKSPKFELCFLFFHVFFSSDNLWPCNDLSILMVPLQPSLFVQTPSAQHGTTSDWP